MTLPKFFALIPAAGIGTRMQIDSPKQYMRLGGKPMMQHVLETFVASPYITHTFVVVSPDDAYIADLLAAIPELRRRISVVRNGGATRQESVLNGLHAIREELADDDWVLVHDAARPGISHSLIEKLITALASDAVGGLLAMPVVDTIKRASADCRSQVTVPREQLWAAQTPQMFRYALLRHALESTTAVTDESSAIEALGLQPKLVEGSPRNFKVTTPQDVALAEIYLKEKPHD